MPATATARAKPATARARAAAPAPRRAAPRRAAAPRARAAAPRARAAQAPRRPLGYRLAPAAAVGRTAVAVGGIADSGLVFRLTRGRLWIGLLATLLVGIVALNVFALSFSASSSGAAGQAEELERSNSALEAQMAVMLSNDELQKVASKLGLTVPAPGAYRYLKAGEEDAAIAAKRLRDGELLLGAQSAPLEGTATETVPAELAPAETAPAETAPAEAAPVETAPVETAPVESAPVETAPPAPATAVGGVASP